MSKIITAKFDSIDAATIAASNAKDRCYNVSSVKVKYMSEKKSKEPYYFTGVSTLGLASSDTSSPSILQNGMFPVAVNVDPLFNDDNYYAPKTNNATVEITTKGGNINPICATLRQGGGIGLKVR